MRDPDYSPELAGRLSKLETAISKQRTVKFEYWSIARDEKRERTIDPYALLPHEGSWYVVGRDHKSDAIRTFKVSRIRRDIKFATRRERDFRLPADFNAAKHRPRRRGRWARRLARRGSSCPAAPPGGWNARIDHRTATWRTASS